MKSTLYKKHILNTLMILFTFAIIQTAVSQNEGNYKGNINLGIETAVQFTGISDIYMPISDNGVGFAVGGFVEYYITDIFSIKGSLLFDNRAFSLGDRGYITDSLYIGKSSTYNITENYKVNYLTIPLSLVYKKGTDKFKFFIQGSFYYSIFLNSNQSGDIHIHISEEDASHFDFENYPELSIPGDYYYKPTINSFSSSDMGIRLSFGGILKVNSNIAISLSPAFNYSFSNVWENPLRETSWTSLTTINLGIIYNFKQKHD